MASRQAQNTAHSFGLVLGAAAVGGTFIYILMKRKLRNKAKSEIEGPLRPPAPKAEDPEPGPLAKELSAFLDSLSDDEVVALRGVIPKEWWEYAVLATYAPDDDVFRFTFHPLTVSIDTMTDEQLDKMQWDLVWAIGPTDAKRLGELFAKAGVIDAPAVA